MAGIAVFLPSEIMRQQAQELLEKTDNHVIINKTTTIDNIVEETRKAIEMGANIVVARGHQACDVEQYTNIPVVEVVMTAQELGLLIMKAKKKVNKSFPVIGLFCWKGMLCDTTYFEQLYDVKLVTVYFNEQEDWFEKVERGIQEGMDVIIGGEKCVRFCSQRDFPVVYLETTGESIGIALKQAENMYHVAEIEKHSYAQFNTVLDSSINGIIKIDANGYVQTMNRAMEELLGISSQTAVRCPIQEVFPAVDSEMVIKVLLGQEETYSTFVSNEKVAMVVIIEPIVVDKSITGAIISCNRTKRLNWSEDKLKEKLQSGFVATETLDHLLKRRPGLKDVIAQAKIYAQSSSPIFIEGYSDGEIESFCQGIHNYSLRKNGPFVVVNLANIPSHQQMHALFGVSETGFDRKAKGAFVKADDGTLVLRGIDKMSLTVQRYLLNAIRRKRFGLLEVDNESIQRVNARIIVCATKNLKKMVNQGLFRRDLYFLLKAFNIVLPHAWERKQDTELLLDEYIKQYLEKYSRYHILTPEAKEKILSYQWDNNDVQLESFCERMILTAKKRKLSAGYVQELMDEIYDLTEEEKENDKIKDTDETMENFVEGIRLRNIREMLVKYNGNRTQAAAALHISKSTLYRYMKKYKLD